MPVTLLIKANISKICATTSQVLSFNAFKNLLIWYLNSTWFLRQAAFVSPENTFRKSFYTLVCVWQLRKIRSMENQICFDQKITTLKRKIIYALILPSKRFWKTHLKRESERELKHTPEDRETARRESEEDNRSRRRRLLQTHPPISSPSNSCHRSCFCHLQIKPTVTLINERAVASRSNPVVSLSSFFSQFDRI